MSKWELPVRLSKVGARMSRLTGVRAIMKDIGEALLRPDAKDFCNLSAGNPVILPEVEKLWRELTRELLDSPEYGSVVCRYGMTQGYEPLIRAVVKYFNSDFGLELSDENVLITPGSQSLHFLGANCFGGYAEDGSLRKIVLPLCPDYTGYGGICTASEAVVSFRPKIEIDAPAHRFKYHPDFSALQIDETTGCVIFSRPSNPTGNILADDEVRTIAALADKVHAPVFIDSAYGPPFPALNFTAMNPIFGPNIVHCMTISKAGLAGERVGITIGSRSVLEVLECFESNAMIHSSRLGQAIVARALASGVLSDLSQTVVRPFYRDKLSILEEAFERHMSKAVPWYLHLGEGAIFAWVWFDQLPLSDAELYRLCKAAGVIVVPGSEFFPGLPGEWQHTQQCLRLSLTASNEHLSEGVRRLAKVIDRVYMPA